MTGRMALAARAHLAWRPVTLIALLSLTLAAALTQGLRALESRSSAAPATGLYGLTRGADASFGPAARASISASIGAQDPAYHFDATPGGLRATNLAQRLDVSVSAAGVQIRQPGLELGLRVHALGYGSSLQPVSAVQPTAAANHATYAHAGLSEWYTNGPLGVEQGFTLAHAPTRHTAGALTVAIALSGDTHATLAPGGQSVTFTGAGGGRLRYAGLSVSDAGGHSLHGWLELVDGQLLMQVDAQHAHFPLRIDPLLEQEAPEAQLSPVSGKGGPEELEEHGEVGLSVAISADGNTALVGAPGGKGSSGAVWVFTHVGSEWVQQQKLEAPEMEGGADVCAEAVRGEEDEECRFGGAVALSANGDQALIGAPRANSGQGAAWIYTRVASSFAPSAELTSPEPMPAGHFGRSVALSYSGNTALVGAPGELKSSGRAWVFTGSGSSWTASAPLAGAGEQGAGHFGRSVALSGSGEVALVGAPLDDADVGAAWVFQREGAAWNEAGQKLTVTGSSEERQEARFGDSVALDEEGNVALVGANEYKGGQGAVWTFARSGDEWSEQAPKLEGASASVEELGGSVALSASGDSALVGAPSYQELRGAAWLYVRTGTSWGSPLRRLFRGAGLTHQRKSRFGFSVSMSADGETMLVGGPTEADKQGAAWIFGHNPKVESIEPKTGTTLGGTDVTIIGWNLSEATAVRFGGTEALSFKVNPEEHSITAESPPGNAGTVHITVETPLGKSEPSANDEFTYMTPGHKSGKGGGGSGGGNGDGGEEPHPTGTPESPPSTGGTTTRLGAEAVLALGPVSSSACGASLLSKQIAVENNDHALFKLLGTGTGKCAGKLRLRVEIKLANKHLKLKTIGVAVFSIASGKRVSVSVKLNAVGRALLKSGHGRLTGNLLLVKQSPVPFISHTASVRLALQRPKPKHKA
jgi:hypothetical protein